MPGIARRWSSRRNAVMPIHMKIWTTIRQSAVAAAFVLVSSFVAAADEPDAATAFEPTENYEQREMLGWRIIVNGAFASGDSEACDETLAILRQHLHNIQRTVPAPAVAKLQSIAIWVEKDEPHHQCAAYHPNVDWLREHDMNPAKAKCVEIANAANFRRWTIDQPWMVLHELSHGYHDQVLGGFDNAKVRRAFEQAMEAKTYDEVLRINGNRVKHYAAANPMEYFAEATEAYFGVNDFYPFVRSELKEHDPAMHMLLGELWRGGK